MPKGMFKTCGNKVFGVFVTIGLLNRDNFTTFSMGDNLSIYASFINSQITVFNQLNEWDLRRKC